VNAEIKAKHQRIVNFMAAQNLEAVALSSRPNFAWFTGGKLNHVNAATQQGVATLIVTRDRAFCLSSNIERPRLVEEELEGTGIEAVEFAWYEPELRKRRTVEIAGGLRVGYDMPVPGLPGSAVELPGSFNTLRWSLLPEEVERYRHVGRAASEAMEATIRRVRPGMTETQIAGLAAHEAFVRSLRPWVLLIAADERIEKFRHPIPTDRRLEKIAMLVFCLERFGLVCSLTRLVSFGPVSDDRRRRHNAVVNVDAAMCLASRPGRTLGQVLETAQRAYAEGGFEGEWRLHHQGGPTGYLTRDGLATPGNPTPLVANQALAWNPSIAGTKSEDTLLIADGQPTVLTAAGPDWPTIQAESNGRTMSRPDILVLS